MIIVFDLDDTLFDEITYVKSSFKAVATHISKEYGLSKEDLYNDFVSVLEKKGRGSVFNDVLDKYDLNKKKVVKKCLSVYRHNFPNIQLNTDAENCLERFKHEPLYVVTDGNRLVQQTKLNALNLSHKVKKTMTTHDYGVKHSKPSTYCFHKILEWEKATPKDLVYIGDNPKKDFVNLKKEGFKTVRILTGCYKNLEMSEEFEAHKKIQSLDELTNDFLNTL